MSGAKYLGEFPVTHEGRTISMPMWLTTGPEVYGYFDDTRRLWVRVETTADGVRTGGTSRAMVGPYEMRPLALGENP